MKNNLISLFLLAAIPINIIKIPPAEIKTQLITQNVFIITIDGFRWQEVFNGADSSVINDEEYTPDLVTMKALYWASTPEERRKKLMPFFWHIINAKGQLYGNRFFGNKVNVANDYAISYPGYNEIFTGTTNPAVSSNAKSPNPSVNILEFLNNKESFHGKVAVFTSWDVFPYILNKERSHLLINSGYQDMKDENSPRQQMINKVQEEAVADKTSTRYDQLTFLTAKEYVQQQRPRVLYLGLGETDEFAHQGRYDLYLDQANQADKMIADLWHWVQTTPGYKDNTTFIITTDHGRGSKRNRWSAHGDLIKGSSQTWLAVIGPHLQPLGEIKEEGQLYQQQVAQTIAHVLGQEFNPDKIAAAITLR